MTPRDAESKIYNKTGIQVSGGLGAKWFPETQGLSDFCIPTKDVEWLGKQNSTVSELHRLKGNGLFALFWCECGPTAADLSARLSAGDQERGCQYVGPAADPARAKRSKFNDFQQQASAFLKVRNETLEIKLVKISVLGGRIRLLLE